MSEKQYAHYPYFGFIALALTLLLATVHPVLAAESTALPTEGVRFKHLSLEQGISNSRVLSVLQGQQGYIWIGTGEGLDRYDGYDFTLYQTDPNDPRTLSNNVIWALYEDREGYLWVGTEGGLNRFDPATETFTRYLHEPDDATSLSDDTVLSLYEDHAGVLWVGTLGGGLNRFDRASGTFTHYQNDPADPQSLRGNEVRGIVEDRAGTLWVGTFGGGLDQLVPGKSAGDPPTFRHFQQDSTNPQNLSDNRVQALHIDLFGILWVATWGGGLNRFDTVTKIFTHYRSDPDNPSSLSSDTTTTIASSRDGELWVGTWEGGLNRFDRTSQTFVRYKHDPTDPMSLSHDSIRSLYISRDNLLFAGTAGGGLNQFDLRPNPFRAMRSQLGNPNSLSQNDVRSIMQDCEGVFWIGTNSAGLNRYEPSTGQFTHYLYDPKDPASLSNNTVRALAEDRDGNLWVGTYGGLDKLERKTGRFVHYRYDQANPRTLSANRIFAIYADRSGTLWVGTDGGLNRFDRQTESFTRYVADLTDPTSLSNNSVYSLFEDGAGVLWVGTRGGLNRLDRESGKFTRYLHHPDDRTSISNSTIPAIYGEPSGMLWLGTYGGLNRFDPQSGHAVHYTMDDGLSSNVVWGILPDEQGDLWLSTNNGLNRFNPATKAVRVYDTDDGLVSAVFNATYSKSSSGEFLFGTVEGLVFFAPAEVRDDVDLYPLVFTGFQLANRPVPIGGDSVLQQPINSTKDLSLSYLDRVISFSFAALNYRAAEKMRYRYVLQGFDTRWTEVDSKRRFVTYTNLGSGSYTFQVQYADRDGVWITPGRAIQLTIVPPWWQTLWFRIALGALLLLGAVGAYRFRIMILQQHNRQLEAQVNSKTTTLQLLNADLVQSISELSTLNQIAHMLNRVAPIETTLERIAVIITQLFHAEGVALCLLSVDHLELEVIDYHRTATPAFPNSPAGEEFQLARVRVAMPQEPDIHNLFHNGKPMVLNGTLPNPTLPRFWPAIQRLHFSHLMLVPIFGRGEMLGTIAIARAKPEQFFTPADKTLAETIANQLAGALENRRLFVEEHRQREVAEKRSRELTTLLNISHEVSSTLELEPLLDLLVQHIAQVIDFSTFLLLELAGEDLFTLALRGVSPSDLSADDEFPVEWLREETELFTTRRPLIVADLAQDPPRQEGMRKTFGHKAARMLQETHSCVIVPMVARDHVVGLLWFGNTQPGCYSEAQAGYITAIAHQAGIAIENAHQYQEMQTAAVDRERNRLAQELHDSVSQTLLSANLMADSLSTLWEQSPEQGKHAVRQLHWMLRNALAEMRTLMLELRPAILAQKPLGEILRQLRDGFAGRSQLSVQLNVDGDTILPAVCQIAFYRVAQGALNNIMQHAHASQVTVDLHCTPKYVELRIADDGVGFDPAAVTADRMGLSIMRERTEKVGATFQVASKPGQGTQITVRYDYPIG